MRKILTGIALLLLLIQLPLMASAAQPTAIALTPDKETVYQGDTIFVTVSISGEQEFTSVGYIPNVDSNVFEIVGGEVLAPEVVISDFSATDGGVLMFSSPQVYTGALFKMELKVKDNAPLGTYTVGGEANAKTSSTRLDVALSGCQITVACRHNVSWTEKTDLVHSGSCTICQAPFSGEHSMSDWTVEGGEIFTSCSDCGHKVYAPDGWQWINNVYYYTHNGEISTGWLILNGTWYYMNGAGVMQTGWQLIGGTWYYFEASGAMLTGWQLIGGTWYYFEGGGAMQTGWQLIDGTWYYMASGGAMQTGWQLIDGTWYYMASGGAMQTGWQLIDGTWYYMASGGAMQTGWQLIGGTWYYFEGGGAMQTGWQLIGGTWYYFEGGGAMQTGWQLIGGTWYYMNAGGAMHTGWLNLGGTWYYMAPGGAMLTGWQLIDGTWYLFNDGGAWIG